MLRFFHSPALVFLFTFTYSSSPFTTGLGLGCLLCNPSKPEVKEGTCIMNMKTGEHWHCTNPACHCEVLVESSGEIDGNNPRCACGGPMKKKYSPPHLTYLEFLRTEEPAVPRQASRGE